MKIEIEVSTKMMKELTPIPFYLLIFYYAYYNRYKKLPSKTETIKRLEITYSTLTRNIKKLLETSNLKGISSYYKDILNLLNSKDSKDKKRGKKKVGGTEKEKLNRFWSYVNKLAKKHYITHKNITFYQKRIQIYVYELIKKIGRENLKEYADWWFREKAPRKDKFTAGIFFYGGIVKEYLEWRNLEDRKDPSRNKEVFHQQVLNERKQYAIYCLQKKKEGKKLEKWEIDVIKQAKKDKEEG